MRPGLLWGWDASVVKIQQCPSYEGPPDGTPDPFTGYNYNTSFIGHGDGETDPVPINVARIRDPSRCALFGDGQYTRGTNKFMRCPFVGPTEVFQNEAAGTQGYRHRGRTNVCYCDGHAESVSDRFTATSDTTFPVGPGTGFLSADNSAYDPNWKW